MLKTSLRLAWRGLNHLTRVTLASALALVLTVAMLMLGLRYWLLPGIESLHDVITISASQAIGQPLTIGKIEADWSGLRPHLTLSDVRIMDKVKPGEVALVLQRVDGVAAWSSMVLGELRLYSLEINKPDLLVHRDVQGKLYIAGVPLNESEPSHTGLADWLLRQARISVRDARITWQDDLRAAKPLVLEHMNVAILNHGQHHRFAMRAQPAPELAAQLDVRGDLFGASFDTLQAWHGELYTQFDYADLAAMRTWLNLPGGFKSGKGATRIWLNLNAGKLTHLTADVALAQVQAQLAPDLAPLDMQTLRGHITWQEVAQGYEVSTRGLSLQMSNGLSLQPTDLYWRQTVAVGAQPAQGEARANVLELADLARMTDVLPLEAGLKKQLAQFAPQGKISDLQAQWQGEADKPLHYQIKAHFDQLAMQHSDTLPGFSGLSGEVAGTDGSGTLTLDARTVTLDAPRIMPEALAFDSLSAKLRWKAGKHGMEVSFNDVKAVNADLAGGMHGSYQSLPDSPGMIDLDIALTRGAIEHAARYVPLRALGEKTHDWLRKALLGGQADEFSLSLHGDLNDFPFVDGKPGVFEIHARTRDVVVEYDKDWPRINNAIGELSIQGKRLQVQVPSAILSGANLRNVSVLMPDMNSADQLLQVRGEMNGETARYLEFIQQSPVHGYIDGFTDDMSALGNGSLKLSVDVPLRGNKPVNVSGNYRFSANELRLNDDAPVLRQFNGELLFTESSLKLRNANAQIFGGPTTIALQNGADGSLLASLNGHADMETLRQNVNNPVLAQLSGGADWEAGVKIQKKRVSVTVTTNLAGMASSLPMPFAKLAETSIPLRFEMRSNAPQQDLISVQYGSVVSAKFQRRQQDNKWVIKRGAVNFGSSSKLPASDGVWISGTLAQASLQDWVELTGQGSSGSETSVVISGADLTIQKLDVYGHGVNALHVTARNQSGIISAQLAAKEINGEVSWLGEGKGKLVAHLKNLMLGSASKQPVATRKTGGVENTAGSEFPALDVTVEELTWKDKPLGHMEVLAQQHGRDWQLEHLRLTNPDGVLNASGKYKADSTEPATQINLKLEISDVGKLLGRSGYPNTMKDGSGKLEGDFSWRGGPEDFSYATLDGTLRLDAGKGQFLKIEPGIGKLLGILSLQALPRHITLDFTDVFSNGFQFENINGSGQIRRGVLNTSDFKIDGSSAKVTMQGQVDLDHETQNLRVRVLPAVSNGVSLLGAFAAGPVVGLGAFIASKLLRDPLDKLVSFEYNVSGTWLNPDVSRVNQGAGAASNTTPGK